MNFQDTLTNLAKSMHEWPKHSGDSIVFDGRIIIKDQWIKRRNELGFKVDESTLVPREEMNDLDWLARNVHEWPAGEHQPWCYVGHGYHDKITICSGSIIGLSTVRSKITKDDWQARRAELQNKPSWDDHDYAVIAQARNGGWYGNNDSLAKFGHESSFCVFGTGWVHICSGVDIGNWRDTLEKRPETNQMQGRSNRVKPVLFIPECGITPEQSLEACSANIDTRISDGNQELSELEIMAKVSHQISDKRHRITNSKYTKTINGVSVDVYDVLQAWNVINPALQHLIKKALQCGQRGHKDSAQDLQDIIDSAIRAKELEC